MSRTLVIAEPGGTAEGKLSTMYELIRVAAECGADAFKPQWVSSAAAHLQRRSSRLDPVKRAEFYATYEQSYGYLEWPFSWHGELSWRAHNLGLEYIVSVCLPQDVWPLERYVDRYKISSFEADDRSLVMTAQATKKPVEISNGMPADKDVYKMPDRLHCVSAYRTPAEQANLSAIRNYGMRGYSDHTRHVIAGALAVAHGAKVVEAHYRLETCDPQNKDYAVALTPSEFKLYVEYVRVAEAMRGTGRMEMQPAERENAILKVSA